MRQRDADPIFSHGRQGLRGRLVLAVDDEEDHLLAYELAFGKEPDLRLITDRHRIRLNTPRFHKARVTLPWLPEAS